MKKVFVLFLMVTSISAYAQVELVSGGSANAYTLAFPGVFSYSNGISITFKSNFANTAAATINVNGLGTKDIRKEASASLAANDIKSGQVVTLVYDGTNFQMTSASGNASGGGGGSQTLSISNDTLSISGGNSVVLPSSGSSGWNLNGNSGTDTSNFIGTTDNVPLSFKVNNIRAGKMDYDNLNLAMGIATSDFTGGAIYNTAFGNRSLQSITTGSDNTAIGLDALASNTEGSTNVAVGEDALGSNTIGNENTSVGNYTLENNTEGNQNTALGYLAMDANTTGSYNTAVGANALQTNTTGTQNVAIGTWSMSDATNADYNIAVGTNSLAYPDFASNNIAIGNSAMGDDVVGGNYNIAIGGSSLGKNVSGENNIAIGYQAMKFNQDGGQNIAIGDAALTNNQSGSENIALGTSAMGSNSTGIKNVALGEQALYRNDDGAQNTGIGYKANWGNYSGTDNAALGYFALVDNQGSNNAAVGSKALWSNTTGSSNTAIGYQADVSSGTFTNATAIGANAYVGASNSLVLGSINGVNDATATTKVGIGTTTPSASLHIDGTLRYRVNGASPTAGQVLTTDALGNATWQNAPGGSGGTGWVLTGNTATDTTSNFVGTTDALPLLFRTNSVNRLKVRIDGGVEQFMPNNNYAFGVAGLLKSATGQYNTAFGRALITNTTGQGNTAYGYGSLSSNQTGSNNTAVGLDALGRTAGNPASLENTAVGAYALYNAFNNQGNIAMGVWTGSGITTGNNNVAIGNSAMRYNNISSSVAIGHGALAYGGSTNIAIGMGSLSGASNTGVLNTIIGYNSGANVSNGSGNTVVGMQSFSLSTTGSNNSGLGYLALSGNSTGSQNTALGYNADVAMGNLSNATAVGAYAEVAQSNSLVLGAINGVNGATANTKVGIGTTTPAQALHVKGKVEIDTMVLSTASTDSVVMVGTDGVLRKRASADVGSGGGGGSQTLSISNDTLSISGGNSVVLPGSGGIGAGWSLTGNAVFGGHFIGTNNAEDLRFRAADSSFMTLTKEGILWLNQKSPYGGNNVFIGDSVAFSATGYGSSNYWNNTVAIGSKALKNGSSQLNTEGTVAIGYGALENFVTDGPSNVAVGYLSQNELSSAFGSNTSLGTYSLQKNQASGNTGIGHAALLANTIGAQNVALGSNALTTNTEGNNNIALGSGTMGSNTTGSNNLAMGTEALFSNTAGTNNTAIGHYALYNLLSGNYNVAIGNSMENATGGEYNIAMGREAANANTTGEHNLAMGYKALNSNDVASNNIALGAHALSNSTGGFGNNIALGLQALEGNSGGSDNIAIGSQSSLNNQGDLNIAIGIDALRNNTADLNLAMGYQALRNHTTGGQNIAIGNDAMSTHVNGTNNTVIGYAATVSGNFSNATAIGAQASAGASNVLVLGSINGVNGATATAKVGIGVTNPAHTLTVFNGTTTGSYQTTGWIHVSDARLKSNVQPINNALQIVSKLNGVYYHWVTNREAGRQVGFLAQDVQKVLPEVVAGTEGDLAKGETLGMAYQNIVPVLVEAMKELNTKVEALEKENAALKSAKVTNVMGYETSFTKTTPVTADDLQNQINELKNMVEDLKKK